MVRLSLLLLLELQSVLGVSPPVQTVDIVRFDPLENTAFTEVWSKSCWVSVSRPCQALAQYDLSKMSSKLRGGHCLSSCIKTQDCGGVSITLEDCSLGDNILRYHKLTGRVQSVSRRSGRTWQWRTLSPRPTYWYQGNSSVLQTSTSELSIPSCPLVSMASATKTIPAGCCLPSSRSDLSRWRSVTPGVLLKVGVNWNMTHQHGPGQ